MKILNYQTFKPIPILVLEISFYNGRILKKYLSWVYNSIGKIISKYDLKEHTDKFSLSLGDHNEPNACYFISVRYQDGSTEVKKILFQNNNEESQNNSNRWTVTGPVVFALVNHNLMMWIGL